MDEGGITARLRELMGSRKLAAFARDCGIAASSMRQYLDGSIPGAEKAAQIAARCNVSLVWLITGEGPKAQNQSVVDKPKSAEISRAPMIDPELFGRVLDRVSRAYRDIGMRASDIDKGRVAAEKYSEIVDQAGDQDEWPALLDLMEVRLKKALQTAVNAPGQTKREA